MTQEINSPNKYQVMVDAQTFETKYSDLIQLEMSDDTVYLTFFQKLPGDPTNQLLKPIARIALTWIHFARLTSICNMNFNKYRGKYMEVVEKTFKGENRHEQ